MPELIVYGLGELGQLYGAAALRAGLRVTPITRADDPKRVLQGVAPEVPVLVAVGEADLESVLPNLDQARDRPTILLQNELFPGVWRRHGLRPTVLVPWLLKKRGTPLLVARPTPVFGLHAELVLKLHRALDVPAVKLRDESALHQALVDKYAFILTINALGLLRDRTLGMWLQEDLVRVDALASEAAQLGAALCAHTVDVAVAAGTVVEAMRALSTLGARGRTAAARVARARDHGAHVGLELPELARVIAQAAQ